MAEEWMRILGGDDEEEEAPWEEGVLQTQAEEQVVHEPLTELIEIEADDAEEEEEDDELAVDWHALAEEAAAGELLTEEACTTAPAEEEKQVLAPPKKLQKSAKSAPSAPPKGLSLAVNDEASTSMTARPPPRRGIAISATSTVPCLTTRSASSSSCPGAFANGTAVAAKVPVGAVDAIKKKIADAKAKAASEPTTNGKRSPEEVCAAIRALRQKKSAEASDGPKRPGMYTSSTLGKGKGSKGDTSSPSGKGKGSKGEAAGSREVTPPWRAAAADSSRPASVKGADKGGQKGSSEGSGQKGFGKGAKNGSADVNGKKGAKKGSHENGSVDFNGKKGAKKGSNGEVVDTNGKKGAKKGFKGDVSEAAGLKRTASAGEFSSQPPAKRQTVQDKVDSEGRKYNLELVVVNFANVGASYGRKCLGREEKGMFDWEGVRRCCRYLRNQRKIKVVAVLNENYRATDNNSKGVREMPKDIRDMCESVEETPRLPGVNHASADDEMTIKCAYRRNCYFLDNDHYRDWKQQLRDEKIRLWLEKHSDFLQMRYFFDSALGTFDLLEGNIPESMLAPDKGVSQKVEKKDLQNIARG